MHCDRDVVRRQLGDRGSAQAGGAAGGHLHQGVAGQRSSGRQAPAERYCPSKWQALAFFPVYACAESVPCIRACQIVLTFCSCLLLHPSPGYEVLLTTIQAYRTSQTVSILMHCVWGHSHAVQDPDHLGSGWGGDRFAQLVRACSCWNSLNTPHRGSGLGAFIAEYH